MAKELLISRGSDDEREYLTLEELKPHQLTELGLANHQPVVTQQTSTIPQINPSGQGNYGNPHIVYYDLNTQQPTIETLYSSGMSQNEIIESDVLSHMNSTRSDSRLSKRTCPYEEKSDLDDDGGDDSKSVRTNDDSKKQNHSEIEKRRRDKMNTYITELSLMIPMCHAMSRKLDKLTVLRMAVQHLKTVRGNVHSFTEGHNKPTFLSEQELKLLILQAAEGFLFVVGCDRGRILYVSESVSQILNFSQGDLLGQSWFDILHPKDVAKVKEQLSSSDLSPRDRLIDAKTMLPVKTDMPQGVSRLCSGARRSFFCRMKCKVSVQVKEENDTNSRCHRRKKQINADKKYSVIQCTGYLKSWPPAKIGLEEQEGDGDEDSCNLSCLVAIGRIPPNIFQPSTSNNSAHCNANLQPIQFISRHAMDGKFLFVDQRATLVLGFLPHELLGTSMYEYYHHEDITFLADSHKLVLETTETVTTNIYRIRTKDSGFIKLKSDWNKFINPWTKETEYLIAKNSVILMDFQNENNTYGSDGNLPGSFEFFNQSNGRDMQRMISTHVEASKIGRQIADEVLDNQRRSGDISSEENSPDPTDAVESHQNQNSDNDHSPDNRHINNRGFNSVSGKSTVSPSHAPEHEIITMMGSCQTGQNEAVNTSSTTGNDEAAMAVIMSLLEADAGLGGSVDFTGLPWPLP